MSEPVLSAHNGEPYTLTELLDTLTDARSYITPTISTHEEISNIVGWCDCGYCKHVPSERPAPADSEAPVDILLPPRAGAE